MGLNEVCVAGDGDPLREMRELCGPGLSFEEALPSSDIDADGAGR